MKNRHGLPILKSQKKQNGYFESLSDEDDFRDEVYLKGKGKCFYCGVSITRKRFTIDHVIPRKRGGTDQITNLVPACSYCNTLKAAMLIEQFRDVFEQVFKTRIFAGERNDVS